MATRVNLGDYRVSGSQTGHHALEGCFQPGGGTPLFEELDAGVQQTVA